ncbi:transcriptional regulator [Listeria floridensis FSL S10-1187]|uniref:Transcriptional regulator n=1 Tax=Listeria floridensis FSL S10-1187 TaxID=1265817 RepID=A0ABP3AZT8_9LIST|nr:hypothetical protein [Listeria floridensis]EUJ33124.1 transcriptional regulator [Listeria floridensis FSL S10-1187]
MFNNFLTIKEVGIILGFKKSASQKVISELNAELRDKGYRTIQGKINKDYFAERYFLNVEDIEKMLKESIDYELQTN